MVGLLIVAHHPLASAFLSVAEHIFGGVIPHTMALDVAAHEDPLMVKQRIADAVQQLNRGKGVLVLVDVIGATPANCCNHLPVKSVTGLNVPMLLRAIQHREVSLENAFSETLKAAAPVVAQVA